MQAHEVTCITVMLIKHRHVPFYSWDYILLQCLLFQFIHTLLSLFAAAIYDLAGEKQLPNLPAITYKGLVTGTQVVSKGRQGPGAANEVQVNFVVCQIALQSCAN